MPDRPRLIVGFGEGAAPEVSLQAAVPPPSMLALSNGLATEISIANGVMAKC